MEGIKTTIGGLPTPVYYPSVSYVSKNTWGVTDHVELLVAANFPQFLVSCFDICKGRNDSRLKAALKDAHEQSQVVLYDSGIYEVVWSRSKRWNRKKYLRTLRENAVSHAFCLDEYVVTRGPTCCQKTRQAFLPIGGLWQWSALMARRGEFT